MKIKCVLDIKCLKQCLVHDKYSVNSGSSYMNNYSDTAVHKHLDLQTFALQTEAFEKALFLFANSASGHKHDYSHLSYTTINMALFQNHGTD